MQPATAKRSSIDRMYCNSLKETRRELSTWIARNTFVLILIHVILGLVIVQESALSTLHVYAVVVTGVILALTNKSIYAAYAAAYIVGAEVLWRMTNASFFWEGGKYAVILVLGLSILHQRKRNIPVLPLLYFVILLPSSFLTLEALDVFTARELISFNLSGPLALFVSAWFFSNLKINRHQFVSLLIILIMPMLSTAVYALFQTFTATSITWANSSMFVTSGGFGPNQVSTIMGLGLIAVWLLLLGGAQTNTRWLLGIVGIVLFIQGVLTFSRGGMIASIIIICFATLHAIKDSRQRSRLIALVMVSIPLIIYIVFPALNVFTGGFLEQRFSDTDLSNRDTIVLDELDVFIQNPIAGIGPGMAGRNRGVAAHTEMTRLLAEHGAFGLVSLMILLSLPLTRYINAKNSTSRSLYSSWMLWSLLVMTNAAMRLAAVSFMYAFAFVQIDVDESE